MAKEKSPIKRDILLRVRLLYAIFIIMALVVTARIVLIQYGNDPVLKEKQRKYASEIYDTVDIPALRGDILGRNGTVLATSVSMLDLFIDLRAEAIGADILATVRDRINRQAKAEKEAVKKDKEFRGKRKAIRAIEDVRVKKQQDTALVYGGARKLFRAQLDTLAQNLSQAFPSRTKKDYLALFDDAIKKKRRHLRLNTSKITYQQAEEILHWPLLRIKRFDGRHAILHERTRGCTVLEEYTVRVRPYGSLARQTIGMMKGDSTVTRINGVRTVKYDSVRYGIEKSFDNYLAGHDGRTVIAKVSGIRWVPVKSEINRQVEHGTTVVTTIDPMLQDIAESELRRQLSAQRANWGSVMLMEVSTGEIHAMVNLTRHSDGTMVEDANYAATYNMEPGSTFKLATMITLIDDAGMSPTEDMIDTEGGETMVGKAKVSESEGHNYGKVNLQKAYAVSSNVAFAKAAFSHYKNDQARFVDYLRTIGLDKPLNLQIDGRAPIILNPKGRWWTDDLTLPMMAYGYAFRITAMRTLALYNAIANDGRMISPLLVKELRRDGQTVRVYSSQTIVPSICKPTTLAFVRQAMEMVMQKGGTGQYLASPHYKVAAKTGTAQDAFDDGGYEKNGLRKYIASFAGYFPADNPRYTCLVVMHTYRGNGHNGQYYGAGLAGPVFRNIADRIHAVGAQSTVERSETTAQAPLKGGKADDVRRVANELGLQLDLSAKEKGWIAVRPDSSGASGMAPIEITPGRVPQVAGLGLREAVYLMESQGLKVRFAGRGKVVWQSLAAGTKASRGQQVDLKLEI